MTEVCAGLSARNDEMRKEMTTPCGAWSCKGRKRALAAVAACAAIAYDWYFTVQP